jgi:hypothetical protein
MPANSRAIKIPSNIIPTISYILYIAVYSIYTLWFAGTRRFLLLAPTTSIPKITPQRLRKILNLESRYHKQAKGLSE